MNTYHHHRSGGPARRGRRGSNWFGVDRPPAARLGDPLSSGEVAEWSNARAWKARIPQGIGGSNPPLSASFKSRLLKRVSGVLRLG